MSKTIKFGTDGWRAIIADQFTFENVELVTKAIALYIIKAYGSDKPVIIGYDTRFMADKFAQKAAETLNKLGLEVKITDRDTPTPVVAYNAKFLNSAGALMFTASHNPPEYCGIKYIPDYAGPATSDITDQIVENVKKIQSGEISPQSNNIEGKTEKFDPKPAYFEQVKKLIDLEKIGKSKIKAIYDPIYSTGRDYLDAILKEYGFDITLINGWIDPLYGGGMPEPAEKYLGNLKKAVLNSNRAVGLSTDGDADRFGVFDEKGRFVTPNQVIAILFKHLLKNKKFKGSVVKTVGTSLMINKIAQMYGDVKVHEVAVGFKHVGQKMREENVIIGGEESGGLSILGHIPEKDGIVANLCLLEAMAYEGKPLYKIVEELNSEIGTEYLNHRIDLKLTEEVKEAAMKMFEVNPPKELGGIKISEITRIDGIKFWFEDKNSWMLVRPSGTEPLLRIYFETDSKDKLENFVNDIKATVERI